MAQICTCRACRLCWCSRHRVWEACGCAHLPVVAFRASVLPTGATSSRDKRDTLRPPCGGANRKSASFSSHVDSLAVEAHAVRDAQPVPPRARCAAISLFGGGTSMEDRAVRAKQCCRWSLARHLINLWLGVPALLQWQQLDLRLIRAAVYTRAPTHQDSHPGIEASGDGNLCVVHHTRSKGLSTLAEFPQHAEMPKKKKAAKKKEVRPWIQGCHHLFRLLANVSVCSRASALAHWFRGFGPGSPVSAMGTIMNTPIDTATQGAAGKGPKPSEAAGDAAKLLYKGYLKRLEANGAQQAFPEVERTIKAAVKEQLPIGHVRVGITLLSSIDLFAHFTWPTLPLPA